MSDQLESATADSTILPTPGRQRPRVLPALLVGVVLVAGAVVVAVMATRPSHDSRALPSTSASAGARDATRLASINDLLRQRSAAIVDRSVKQFMSTVDPESPAFSHSQRKVFANLSKVHFAAWSYTVGDSSMAVPVRRQQRYAAATWAPTDAAVHYRIAGFDSASTNLPQYPTFVQRAGHWYLGSLTDFTSRGDVSATDVWDYGPIAVVHRADVLVLGAHSELATMRSVAGQMATAVPRVTAVWGTDWARRVIVQVPATQHEMGLITADSEDLDQIAALTSAEISTAPGRPSPVGDRVTINPANWGKLGTVGAEVVLTHELTHVATRADTGTQTPKWLSEGFADYVGFRDAGLPAHVVASELATDVRAGRTPARLPTNSDFRGANPDLSQAYEASWLACRYIAARFGQPALVRFYRAVGTSHRSSSVAVARALQSVLALSHAEFVARWRGYVDQQLAA